MTRAWRLGPSTVIVLLAMTGVAMAAHSDRLNRDRVPVRPISPTVPTLHGAVALGTLVALDSKADVAEFRIRCGWYAVRGKPSDLRATIPKRKLRPGLWKVPLRTFSLNTETYPNGPGSGIAHTAALKAWERYVSRFGSRGTVWSLYLPSGWSKPYLSDGPTTDICRGVLS